MGTLGSLLAGIQLVAMGEFEFHDWSAATGQLIQLEIMYIARVEYFFLNFFNCFVLFCFVLFCFGWLTSFLSPQVVMWSDFASACF
jgi:hypothetical protein